MFVGLRAIRLKKAGKGALSLFPFTFEQEVGRPALDLENVIFICSSRLCGGESFGGSPAACMSARYGLTWDALGHFAATGAPDDTCQEQRDTRHPLSH
jgi:hypothetical protein